MLGLRTYLAALAACLGSAVACGSSDDNALMRSGAPPTGGAASGGGGTGADGNGGSPDDGNGGSPDGGIGGSANGSTGGSANGSTGGSADGGTGGGPDGGTGGSGDGGTGGTEEGGTGGAGLSDSGGSPAGGVPTGGMATGGRATGGFGTGGTPPTICGNGILEPGEPCEDGNREYGDSCSPLCEKEPYCTSLGCISKCGDGLLAPSTGEECDDGNLSDGDGCSSSCLIEPGYDCTQPTPSTLTLPMVLRDFDANGEDFEPAISGSDNAVPGIVQTALVGNKPAFSGTNSQQPAVAFDSLFPDWYRDAARNVTVVGSLVLYANGQGGYVNRWGPNGEQWTAVTYNNVRWCSNTALRDGCAACSPRPATGETCFDSGCTPWGNQQECVATVVTSRHDGNPTFFPLDGQGLAPSCQGTDSAVANPTSPCAQARVPPAYMNGDPNWLLEPGGAYHNFGFTSEVRFAFYYDSARTYQLDFQGDDDVWVFVNRQLALDLGGIHTPASGSVQLPRDAATLGLTDGRVYEVAIFQAERQTTGSTYKLTLTGFNLRPTQCTLR